MKSDYLAVFGRDAAAVASAVGVSLESLSVRYERPFFTLLASPTTPVLPLGCNALLVGRAFSGSRNIKAEALEAALAEHDPRRLFATCWGDFLIFASTQNEQEIDLFRSPTGQMHAYRTHCDAHWFVASEAEFLLGGGLVAPKLDDIFLAHHIAFPHLRSDRTGLAGIDEPFAGDRTTMSANHADRACGWSPWHFAAGQQLDDVSEIKAALRASVTLSVEALVRDVRSPLLELSGGLDSSIVGAALNAVGRRVDAINLVAPAAEGDERVYARMVADRFGFGLVERFPDECVDLTEPPSVKSPRPGLPGLLRGWEHHFVSVARELSIDAFVSGTGGDNVFCSVASAAPAADLLRMSGPGRAFVRVARDVAVIHGASIGRAAWMATRQAFRRPPRPIWPQATHFLTIGALPTKPLFHPWLEEPVRGLAGKRIHIRSIMAAMAHLDGYARHTVAPSVFPLLAQPVVETCLRIPTWHWVAGGRDRAMAREAFAQQLPPAIVARRTKGRINSYAASIFRMNRKRLRPLLLEGCLARLGLLDRPTIDLYLQDDGPVTDDRFYHLFPIVDTEVWARSWSAH